MTVNISDHSSPSVPIHPQRLGRRRVVGLAAATAAAVPALALLPDAPALALPGRPSGRHVLRPDDDGITKALDVPIAHPAGRAVTNRPVRSAVMETTEFAALGVTWASGNGVVRVRTRLRGAGWTPWRTLSPLHDLPDPRTAEAAATPRGTEMAWTGDSDAVQVELDGTQVAPVLTLIDPGHAAVAEPVRILDDTPDEGRARVASSNKHHYRNVVPELHTRASWHPNPAFMNPPIGTIKTVKQVHVHHTDSPNSYTRADVPRLIRAMYRYHTKTRGWADIGYNFLVDKYGGIWVGRKGSMHMARGAHTLGFNHCSVGVAAIGNFQKLTFVKRDGHGSWKGRVITMRVVGSKKTVTVSGDAFRVALGLRSTWFHLA